MGLRSVRITLVAIHTARSPQSVPLANAFLAAALNASPLLTGRVTVTLVDLFPGQTREECLEAISATDPDLVGFSIYLWNRECSCDLARLLRECQPELTLFCGGPEPTADPANLIAEAPWDFLVAGEGEAALVTTIGRVLEEGDLSEIPGVGIGKDGVLQLVPGVPVTPLDSIPSPFLTGILDPAAYSGLLWQLSRGCSFDCDFCFDAGRQSGVRRFSLERVEAELRWFVANGVAQVFVLDSTFNQDKRRAKEILRLIKRIAPGIHFHFEVRSEFIDREMAGQFAGITCSLQIGLQSASKEVLKGVGRNFDPIDFAARVALLNESGAIFGFDLIYGLPGDTLAGFRTSLDFALSLYPNHLDIFPLSLLPATRLAGRSAVAGLEHLPRPPYTLISSPTFSREEMASAGWLAAACDIFYSRGKAVAWFNSVLHGARLGAAQFLEQFGDWLDASGTGMVERELSDGEIWQMQRKFLGEIFATRRLKRLLPLVLDLVDYNYCYAAALMAVAPIPPTPRKLGKMPVLAMSLRRADSAQLAKFSYEVLQLLDAGMPDLEQCAACLLPTGSYAVIYPRQGEVRTESLMESYYRLLERLDGVTPAGSCAAELGMPPDDTIDFLAFALAEGIVVA